MSLDPYWADDPDHPDQTRTDQKGSNLVTGTTTTPQHRDERPVTAPLWAWERFLTHAANDDHWNHEPGTGETAESAGSGEVPPP